MEEKESKPALDCWQSYHKITESLPPHPLLVRAVQLIEDKNVALDFGAGSLRDAKFLAEQRFQTVEAVDKSKHILELSRKIPKLIGIVSTFDSFYFSPEKYSLINAHYSLPFNPPQTFDTMFDRLKTSIAPGGVFVGQLFGPKDGRNPSPNMTFHTASQAIDLLENLEIVQFDELEYDGQLANGAPHHWHRFDIIARKNTSKEIKHSN